MAETNFGDIARVHHTHTHTCRCRTIRGEEVLTINYIGRRQCSRSFSLETFFSMFLTEVFFFNVLIEKTKEIKQQFYYNFSYFIKLDYIEFLIIHLKQGSVENDKNYFTKDAMFLYKK